MTISLSSYRASTWWKAILTLFLILILGRFIVVGLAKILFNTQSSDGDESAYLALGLALREEAILTDGTRPPLYPLLLAPVAERSWSYFTWAKLMTLGVGALTVLVTFFIGQRLFNGETGLLAAFVLGMNKEFHLRASTVYADTLLALLFVAAWYFLIKSFERGRYSYLAGFVVGLAYLTKSSATLLLVAWALAAWLQYRHRIFWQRHLLITPLVFLLTTSPLLIYNWSNFGSPFYNFATTHVMWMDRWAESQVADETDLPTLWTYLQSHTVADMVARLQVGVARLNSELARTLIPSRTFEPAWLSPVGGVGALLLIGWLFIFERAWLAQIYHRRHPVIQISLFLAILFYIFSAWYARVLIESRFLIPILGPFYLLYAAGLVGLLDRFRQWGEGLERSHSGTRKFAFYQGGYGLLIAAALAWGGWGLVSTARIDSWSLGVDPFESDRQANIAPETALTWLVRDHPPQKGTAHIIFGPSKSLPLWKFPSYFTFELIPVDMDTWQELKEYLSEVTPDYIIIDSDTARRRRQALRDYFSYDDSAAGDRGLEIRQIPPGWSLAYLYDDAPHTWSVFTFATPTIPMRVNLDDQIELQGYDLIHSLAENERRLDVTLYWQALTTPRQDYTIFLHLTAPDGFVKAQQDRQPFAGLWPTSRWRKGDLFADHFTITLEAWIQPGDYLLLTGLYEPQSGERLAPVNAAPAPSANAILLGQVRIE
jgi:hypothetical protein